MASDTDSIPVGAISFHGGRPHYDELKIVCALLILGRIKLSMNNVRIIINNRRYANNPALARKHFEKGDPRLGGKRVIFVGWTPGDGDWNPFDEHENISRARRESSAVGKLIADMGEQEVRTRLDAYLESCGCGPGWRKRATDWFLHEITIDSWKDHSSTARELGPSRLHKVGLYADCFPIGEDGAMTERPYSQAQIQAALRNTWQVMLNTLCMYDRLEPGVEKDVERLVVRTLTDRYHGKWKPGRDVKTVRGLIAHHRKVRDGLCADIDGGKKPASTKAQKKRSVRNKCRGYIRELDLLARHFANMRNRADYKSDAWLIQGWLLDHNVSCPVPVTKETTVEELLATLKARTDAPAILVDMLRSYTTDPVAMRKLGRVRKRRKVQEPGMDEEHWSCPLALHHQIGRMLGRESMTATAEGAALRVGKGAAFRFTKRAVSAYLAGHALREHARSEVAKAKKAGRLHALVSREDGAEPIRACVLHLESLNPLLTSVLREEFDVSIVTWGLQRSAYVAIDHDALGHEVTDSLYRRLAIMLRALEYRARELDLPENWWDLAKAGKAVDGVWYLHVLPKERNLVDGEGSGYEAAVNLLARSIFHRHSPGTRLSAEVICQAVQLVWTLHQLPGRYIRHGEQKMRFTTGTVDNFVEQWLYAALRLSTTFDEAIEVIEAKAKDLPTFAVLAA